MGRRIRRGSCSMRLIKSSSASFSRSSPSFLKAGERKLNITEAGCPCSSASISSRVKGVLKKSRSLISTLFSKRNSLAFRQVVHLFQQKKSTFIIAPPFVIHRLDRGIQEMTSNFKTRHSFAGSIFQIESGVNIRSTPVRVGWNKHSGSTTNS